MLSKKQKIVFCTLFGIVFIGLLLIATFYDLQISNLLAGKWMIDGNYMSSNKFARFFEVVGEMPLYLFIMVACAIIVSKCLEIKRTWLKVLLCVLFFVIGVGLGYYGGDKFWAYIYKLDKVKYLWFDDNILLLIITIVLSIVLEGLFVLLILKKLKTMLNQLLPLAVIVLIAALISNGIVQGAKPFFARERYRAIYYLDYLKYTDHPGFTPWYVIGGSSSKIVDTFPEELGVTSTFFSSFPSGHTCAAGITYSLMFIPLFIDKFKNSKYRWIFIAIGIFYTGLVAFTRILMGAHYLSDVLFGGTIVFLSNILAYVIVNSYLKKKNINN